MGIDLAGGVKVSSVHQGEGAIFDRGTGTKDITLRVVEVAAGRRRFEPTDCDDVFYVLAGGGMLSLDGQRLLGADTGFYVRPGQGFEISATTPMTLIASRCPPSAAQLQIARLADCVFEMTGDRWYKVLLKGMVTQFVGAIPPGRAPDHFHEYEEVLCILSGRGRVHAGDSSAPIERGTCIYLPRRQMHCVENTGESELRLLGVFYPAGSPAVRYSRVDHAEGEPEAGVGLADGHPGPR
jgi:mannose-6-phosphate isomerase-like protein (cupin superfamily)